MNSHIVFWFLVLATMVVFAMDTFQKMHKTFSKDI